MTSKTIVFIHGAWVTSRSWDPFISYFEAQGYTAIAPNWPTMDRPVGELNATPLPELAELNIETIVAHYQRIIEGLDEPPIIIGHSFGGLFTQILLDRGVGAAGIAIDSAPTNGVSPNWDAVKALLPVLTTWRGWKKVVRMSEKTFANEFANGMPFKAQSTEYSKQIVPSPGRIFFQVALSAPKVDYGNRKRAPLLMIAGENDKTVPAELSRRNFKKYQDGGGGPTEFKEYPNRSHTIIVEPGWEEVAQDIHRWIESL